MSSKSLLKASALGCISMLLLISPSIAWNITTDPYTFSGQVGIGTETPYGLTELDVVTDGWRAIRVKQITSGLGVSIDFENGDGFSYRMGNGQLGNFFLQGKDPITGQVERLIEIRDNYVGIKKNVPQAALHVGGDAQVDEDFVVLGEATIARIPPQGDVLMGDFTQ